MIYRLIDASNVIANVQDTFNINSADWIGRAGNWINKALTDIGVVTELKVTHLDTNATDYRVELPCDIKSLVAVEVNGMRVYRTQPVTQMEKVADSTDTYTDSEYAPETGRSYNTTVLSYSVQGDNYIQFETNSEYYKEIAVTLHYKSLPTSIFKPYNMMLPMIPDIDIAQDAIANYIMIKILGRGYNHPVYSLNNNHPATNPYLAYYGVTGKGGLKQRARIKVKSMDADARERVSASVRSFNHPNRHNTTEFDNRK